MCRYKRAAVLNGGRVPQDSDTTHGGENPVGDSGECVEEGWESHNYGASTIVVVHRTWRILVSGLQQEMM